MKLDTEISIQEMRRNRCESGEYLEDILLAIPRGPELVLGIVISVLHLELWT
jgi:hypothetical protein